MVLNLRAQGGVASYESEDDHGYSHFVDAMSHEQRAVVSAARDRDVEDQHIAQVQLRSMKVSRPSAVVRKPSHASRGSRRPATSPGGRNPTGPSRFQRPHRASAEGTIGVTQFDMEMWERSLPRETAHQHLQVQKKPRQSDDEGRSERTVDIEVSSSDTSIMGYAPGSKKKPRHQDRHF
ncbi:hypothetical protein FRC03_008833 [Tulasnella sp. 419]|nr:hypothetical protein FRC03_008833 [Tulasnella sp. 419]